MALDNWTIPMMFHSNKHFIPTDASFEYLDTPLQTLFFVKAMLYSNNYNV